MLLIVRLNYLSAQCPFGTLVRYHAGVVQARGSQLPFGSVPFRHGDHVRAFCSPVGESQLPFGSVPFRHVFKDGFKIGTWLASQLPFGSVPFRHVPRHVVTKQGGFVGLNYLSAQCPFGTPASRGSAWKSSSCLNYLSAQCPFGTSSGESRSGRGVARSQLPFGSVPFRHERNQPMKNLEHVVSITFRLSALSARGTPLSRRSWRLRVSITFRLSALSALGQWEWAGEEISPSQLPFGSVPFRHFSAPARVALISSWVSITFRLSALSAHEIAVADTIRVSQESQLPFGSVPFRHKGSFKLGTWLATVSITFRLSALSARRSRRL